MKIDRKKVEDKLNKLRSTGQGSNKLWSPKPGVYTIRALEYPHFTEEFENDDICPEYWFHYNIAKGSIVCLEKNFGEACPICEAVEKLRDAAVNDVDVWKQMMSISAQPQAFLPVIVRDQEEPDGSPSVKLWRINKTIHADLLDQVLIADDDDEPNLFDLKQGVDLKVTKVGASAQNKFGKTTIVPKTKRTPIAGSKEEIKTIIEAIPKIEDIYEKKSEEDLQKMVDKWSSGIDDEPTTTNSSNDDESSDVDESLLNNLLEDDDDEKEDDDE